MVYSDVIGSLGVGLILIAYFLNSFAYIPKDGSIFFALNIAGSALACFAAFLIDYMPFIVLEGAWCVVSVIGLLKRKR